MASWKLDYRNILIRDIVGRMRVAISFTYLWHGINNKKDAYIFLENIVWTVAVSGRKFKNENCKNKANKMWRTKDRITAIYSLNNELMRKMNEA